MHHVNGLALLPVLPLLALWFLRSLKVSDVRDENK